MKWVTLNRTKITCDYCCVALLGTYRDHDRLTVLTDLHTLTYHTVGFGILPGARYNGLCRVENGRHKRQVIACVCFW